MFRKVRPALVLLRRVSLRLRVAPSEGWRMGRDYPTLRVGSNFGASLLTLARKAPHRSNGVRISVTRTNRARPRRLKNCACELADGEGFEPSVPFWGTHAFQACTIDHSVTHPDGSRNRKIDNQSCKRRNNSSSGS